MANRDENFQNQIVKFNAKVKRLMIVKDLDFTMSPLSKFPNEELAKTFSEYHQIKNGLSTLHDDQPLVEINYLNINANFILRNSGYKISRKEKSRNTRELFLMEHLTPIPIKENQLSLFSMLPSIFYRVNCILKAKKFQLMVEKQILSSLKLENASYNEPSWDKSINFHKMTKNEDLRISAENLIENSESNSLSDEDSEIQSLIMFKNESCSEQEDVQPDLSIPSLIIKDELNVLPNVYNILQCLTLKNACDNFDMERYEILGDCFLKLIVVMKIYIDFFQTNEGKMACLKSMRVSNRYLYKLAMQKNLGDFVVSQNFSFRENWIGPYFDRSKLKNDQRSKIKLSDKSLADCIEALIGAYLINTGANAARAFIEWLDFSISDQNGKANFTEKFNLPDPLLSKNDVNIGSKLNKYSEFEAQIGYNFKNKFYIYQAFTHASDETNIFTSSYQKLKPLK